MSELANPRSLGKPNKIVFLKTESQKSKQSASFYYKIVSNIVTHIFIVESPKMWACDTDLFQNNEWITEQRRHSLKIEPKFVWKLIILCLIHFLFI